MPKIEIYGGETNHPSTVTNSRKVSQDKRYEECKILGTDKVIVFDKEQREAFQMDMHNALKEHGINYLTANNTNNSISEYVRPETANEDFKVYAGANRQQYLLSKADSILLALQHIVPASIAKQTVWLYNVKAIKPAIRQSEFDYKIDKAIEFTRKKYNYSLDESELLKELDDLGVQPSDASDWNSLQSSVQELADLIEDHRLEHEDPKDIDVASRDLMANHYFKTMRNTMETYYFTGKVYDKNSEQKIGEELEKMQDLEHDISDRLVELGKLIEVVIIARNKRGENNFELARYQYGLTKRTYEEKFRQMKVRIGYVREVVKKIGRKTYS